jgi:anti-anti-sigma regulatory factor
MLRISIHEDDRSIGLTLAGRLAGPWVAELSRAWLETAGRLDGKKKLMLDLRDLTYWDADGKRALKEIFTRTRAELITSSFWSEHLANEIRSN